MMPSHKPNPVLIRKNREIAHLIRQRDEARQEALRLQAQIAATRRGSVTFTTRITRPHRFEPDADGNCRTCGDSSLSFDLFGTARKSE